MEIREIDLWDRFTCLGSKCPDSCCKGWIIPLSNEDRIRFLRFGGSMRLSLICAMLGHRLGDFNSSSRVCPFLSKDKLCKLQLKKGHDFIPETCRSYPRAYRNYGEFEERFVDLSCILVAKLFVEHHKDLHMISREGEPETEPYSTNDDTQFLHDLVSSRELMIDELKKAGSYEDVSGILKKIDAYAAATQKEFIHGHTDHLRSDPFDVFICRSDPSSDDKMIPDAPGPFKEGVPKYNMHAGGDVFPLGASAVNYLMNTPLVSEYLKYGNDYIYSIFCLYTKDPAGTMTDKRLSRIREAYHNAYPEYASVYAAYYIYYLYKFYMNCYEDYSFVRNVRMGFIHLGMIEFLHALYYDKKSTLPVDEFTHILSAYNKRAYFNYENLDEMYEVFIADFF